MPRISLLSCLYAGVLELLYPRRCPVCSEIVMPKGNLICPGCMEKLSVVRRPVCKCCGKEIVSPEAEYCCDCTRHSRSFDSGMALINYDDTASRSMAQVKYHGRREYLDFYAEAIFRRFAPAIRRISPDCIIPVPVHKSRLRKRGFNQAEELARRLSERTGIPVRNEFLKRTRKTLPQKALDPSARLKNLEQAFECAPLPDGIRTVLLTDDIYTTGSTAEACARALKNAGAERVVPIVICIGSQR